MFDLIVVAALCVYFLSLYCSKVAYFVKKILQSEDSLENDAPNIWRISITKQTFDQPAVTTTTSSSSKNNSTTSNNNNKDIKNTICIITEKKDLDTHKPKGYITASLAESKLFSHYNKPLSYSVRYIMAWIKLKKVTPLDCLSEIVSEHLPDESVAKSILIELFSCHCTSRLQIMLDYMHTNNTTTNSTKLADSIAKLVLIALHIPLDVTLNKQSPFCHILSSLTNSFLSTSHPFLCDYILYVLKSTPVDESILSSCTTNNKLDSKLDLDCSITPNTIETTDKRPSSFLEVFKKSIFLTPITVNTATSMDKSSSSSIHLLSRFFRSQKAIAFEDDVQLLLFRRYSIMSLDKVRSLTSEILALCNNFLGCKLDSKDMNTTRNVASDDITFCSSNTKEKGKARQDDTIVTDEKVGRNKRRHTSTEQQNYYVDQVKFKNLLQLRKGYLRIKKKLKAIVVDEDINVFNKVYILCYWGHSMPQDTALLMERIQDAYKILVTMFDQLEQFIKVEEVDYLFNQICDFISAYETVADTNFLKITSIADGVPLTYENITKLRNSVDQCIYMASTLEKVFQKYLETSNIFDVKKNAYTAQVNDLCAACYEHGHQMKIVDQVLDKD